MIAFWLAVIFTLSVSAFCSLLEAMILSTTAAEVETLKARNRRKGEMLELFKANIEETSSAILSLNTVANTLGATISGVLAADLWGSDHPTAKYVVPLAMTLGILLLSEILPKNLGVLYRPAMQPHMVSTHTRMTGFFLDFEVLHPLFFFSIIISGIIISSAQIAGGAVPATINPPTYRWSRHRDGGLIQFELGRRSCRHCLHAAVRWELQRARG